MPVLGIGLGTRGETVRRVVLSSSAALCLAVGTLTACGGGSGTAVGTAKASSSPKASAVSPLQAVQAAYTKTADARSMQFVMDGKVSSTGMNMDISASGVEDITTKAADMTMTMPFLGQMQMRLVGGAVYVKIGGSGSAGGINTGGKWMKEDVGAANSLGSDSGFDAQEMLGLLKSMSASGVTDRGSATVRGVQTTHYSAQLDLAKIAAQAGVSGNDSSDLQSMFKDTGLSAIPIDLYIDAQGRVRRVAMSMTMKDTPSATPSSASGSDGGLAIPMSGTFAMTMDFFNFGVPVNVTAPPASDVTDGSNLLNGLGSSGSTD
jgi:hypothetical protein